jgi:glycosyltransferase involved in cell wall biosynthesis
MAAKQNRLMIAIPLYNHGKTVFKVIERCQKLHADIIVINDGSTDIDLKNQHQKNRSVIWIHHSHNQGKGAAIMTAVRKALDLGMTHLITIDADLQHKPEDLLMFKQAILDDPDTLYIGKRDFSDPRIPKASKFGRSFSNFWFRVQTGQSTDDAQSGFRAYPLFIFENLSFSDTHYSFEVEVLVKSVWAGVAIKDIDISVHYPPPEKRVSHFKLFKDNLRLTHLNTKLTLRSFLPLPHKKIFTKSQHQFSIFHPLKSIRLFLANNVSAFQIAMSGSIGVFLGTLPLIALHTITILLVTGYFRLNKLIAVGTSQFCMPPLVPAICIEAGYFLTHDGTFLTEISLKTIGSQGLQRLFEWFLGSLIIAPTLSVLSFCVIYSTATILTVLSKKT